MLRIIKILHFGIINPSICLLGAIPQCLPYWCLLEYYRPLQVYTSLPFNLSFLSLLLLMLYNYLGGSIDYNNIMIMFVYIFCQKKCLFIYFLLYIFTLIICILYSFEKLFLYTTNSYNFIFTAIREIKRCKKEV